MPRKPRHVPGGHVYHVLNRGAALRRSVNRGAPFGSDDWQTQTVEAFDLHMGPPPPLNTISNDATITTNGDQEYSVNQYNSLSSNWYTLHETGDKSYSSVLRP